MKSVVGTGDERNDGDQCEYIEKDIDPSALISCRDLDHATLIALNLV